MGADPLHHAMGKTPSSGTSSCYPAIQREYRPLLAEWFVRRHRARLTASGASPWPTRETRPRPQRIDGGAA